MITSTRKDAPIFQCRKHKCIHAFRVCKRIRELYLCCLLIFHDRLADNMRQYIILDLFLCQKSHSEPAGQYQLYGHIANNCIFLPFFN